MEFKSHHVWTNLDPNLTKELQNLISCALKPPEPAVYTVILARATTVDRTGSTITQEFNTQHEFEKPSEMG